MKLGRGNKFFWGQSGLFVVQKGQFHGQFFLYHANFKIKKKRQKTGLSSTNNNEQLIAEAPAIDRLYVLNFFWKADPKE
jgi:hypothetical protein